MKIKEKVALLEAMNKSLMDCYFERKEAGDLEGANQILHESMGLDRAIWILTDARYAENMKELYCSVLAEI